jgi:hypothetical protein
LGAFDFTFEVVWTEFYQAGGNAPLLSPADIRTSVEMAQSREQSSLRKTSTESNSITADPPTQGSHLCTTQHLLQIKMPGLIYPRLSRQCLVHAQLGPTFVECDSSKNDFSLRVEFHLLENVHRSTAQQKESPPWRVQKETHLLGSK